jgi:demethylmenaquinone methyltransferase / 2-methoxy-6-polyprenyl-1,4-benzoquinol methylase
MAILPYSTSGGSKKAEVRSMFNNIASTYDGLNRVLSLGIDQLWRKKLITRLKAHSPSSVLDVATGTADLAIAEAQAMPTKVIGLDISEGMLAVGRKKIASLRLNDKVILVQGDSEALAYPDSHFDAVTVAFGVRNFENLEQGLAEIKRVLRPGGILLVLEFGTPPNALVRIVYNFYSSTLLPFVGKLVSKDARAYSYLPESVRAFPSGEAFIAILTRVGFLRPSSTALTFGVCMLYEGTAG